MKTSAALRDGRIGEKTKAGIQEGRLSEKPPLIMRNVSGESSRMFSELAKRKGFSPCPGLNREAL